MLFGNDESMWGRAIYFAVNAFYSEAYTHMSDGKKMMLLAEVLIGDTVEKPAQKFIKPPFKSNSTIEYDSV